MGVIMSTRIINEQFSSESFETNECKDLLLPGEYKITAVGIGEAAINQIYTLCRKQREKYGCNSITIFNYDVNIVSAERDKSCM